MTETAQQVQERPDLLNCKINLKDLCDQESINSEKVIATLLIICQEIDKIVKIAKEKKSPHIKFVGRSIEKILLTKKDGVELREFISDSKTKKTIGIENTIEFSAFEKNSLNRLLHSINHSCNFILEEYNPPFFQKKIESITSLVSIFINMKVEDFHKQKREIFQFLESDICAEA